MKQHWEVLQDKIDNLHKTCDFLRTEYAMIKAERTKEEVTKEGEKAEQTAKFEEAKESERTKKQQREVLEDKIDNLHKTCDFLMAEYAMMKKECKKIKGVQTLVGDVVANFELLGSVVEAKPDVGDIEDLVIRVILKTLGNLGMQSMQHRLVALEDRLAAAPDVAAEDEGPPVSAAAEIWVAQCVAERRRFLLFEVFGWWAWFAEEMAALREEGEESNIEDGEEWPEWVQEWRSPQQVRMAVELQGVP